MGLTLSFIMGSSAMILNALQSDDYDLFYNEIDEEADFSLQLQPKDIETLSVCASEFNGNKPMSFRKQIAVLLDDEDKGLFLISDRWINYIGSIPLEKHHALCVKWFEKMNDDYPDEDIEITEDAIVAVKDLLEICRLCINTKKELLHYWSL